MKKYIVDPRCLHDIFDKACDFAKEAATPSSYTKKDEPEKEMQKEFGRYMSRWYNVLREIEIRALARLEDAGDENWKIDESMQLDATDGGTYYIVGELKFHGTEMKDRKFVKECKTDIRKMRHVANQCADVTMSFTIFVTCNEKERDEVYQFAKNLTLDGVTDIRMLPVAEEGYYGVAVLIIPKPGKALYQYAQVWAKRMEYLQYAKMLKDYYFKQK